MSRHRFFIERALPSEPGPFEVPLSSADKHHATRVLRVEAGEEIVAVEPDGTALVVRVERATPERVIGCVVGNVTQPPEPHITLVQGIVKGQGMDEIVQHAVELGAERIVPLVTARTIVRLDAGASSARTARWQKIAESAAAQSQRARVAVVTLPRAVADLGQVLEEHNLSVVLWEESAAEADTSGASLSRVLEEAGVDAAHPQTRVALVVGPEGGLTAEEVSALASSGARVASLGGAILRAQTAALAAVALTANALGALSPPSGRAEGGFEQGRLEDAS